MAEKKTSIIPPGEIPETQQEYRQRITELICDLLAEGKTLTSICSAEIPEVPRKHNFLKWLANDDALRYRYACAREAQADYIAEQTVDIADTEPDPQVARVRIDARKWFASKVAPKKYGDKMTLAGDPENPLHGMTDEQLQARLEVLRKNASV